MRWSGANALVSIVTVIEPDGPDILRLDKSKESVTSCCKASSIFEIAEAVQIINLLIRLSEGGTQMRNV